MNHAFVTTRHKAIDPEVVDQVLRRVATEVFGGLLIIERDEGGRVWGLRLGDKKSPHGMVVFFKTTRRLDLRRHFGGDITGWTQSVVQDEVGKALGGMLGDEGITDRWEPGKESFPTFRAYYKVVHSHLPGVLKSRCYRATMKRVSKDLRKVLERRV